MGGTNNLVVTPAVAIKHITLAAAFAKDSPAIIGAIPFREVAAYFEQCIRSRAVDSDIPS